MKISRLFRRKEEKERVVEKVFKRFIPTTTLHGSSGPISKMTVYTDGQYIKVWASSRMYHYLKSYSSNLPGIDWTFGKETPPEELDVIREKGKITLRSK